MTVKFQMRLPWEEAGLLSESHDKIGFFLSVSPLPTESVSAKEPFTDDDPEQARSANFGTRRAFPKRSRKRLSRM
jgi:hypothetical protein